MKFIKMMLLVLLSVVTFGQSTYAAPTFKDVSTKHGNYEEIEWAVSQGLLKGYSDQTFRPSKFLTESQFAKIFTRYTSPDTLADVPAEKENETVYNYFTSKGIKLNGHTVANAKNKNFTRIQVAKVFYQQYEGKVPASNTVVIDWMYTKGLTTGKGVSSNKYRDFGSNDPLKRAHISAFFSRYDKMINAEDEPVYDDQIINDIIKNELGSAYELIQFDRINLTAAVDDELFIYLRDKSASLVDLATNTYIVASYDTASAKSKVLKKWSDTTEYSFLQRESLNDLEQMLIWSNTGSDLRLELTVVAANANDSVVVTPITKVYKNGSFYVERDTLYIEDDAYRLVNGKLVEK